MAPTAAHTLRALPAFGLAACALVCASCTLKPPTFAVADIAISDSTPEATILQITLLGENPNSEPTPLYEINYSMTIDGTVVESARRSPQVTIPAHGSQEFVFPVVVPVAAMDPARLAEAAYRVSGSVTYIMPGTIAELFFDSNIRRPSQGFAESGSFAPDLGMQESPSAD